MRTDTVDFTIHIDTSLLYVISSLLGGFIIVISLVSLFVKQKLFLSDPMLALLFGIIIGPTCLNILDPLGWPEFDQVTFDLSKYIIAIQVMAAGVSMPKAYLRREFVSMFMLLIPTMLAMWLVSAALIHALLPLTFLQSLIIAACVTPTDPVLANSVVKGRFAEKNVPLHVRDILSAESGANDGLGLPYLYLALYLLHFDKTSDAIIQWVVMTWLYEIIMAVAFGAFCGFVFRKLIYTAERYDLIDKESFLAFWIALALFLTGTLALLGSDDILACFVAGNAFAWDNWFSNETREAHLQEVVDLIFNFAYFVYLGSAIPWSIYTNQLEGVSVPILVGLAVLILFLRRLPALLLLSKFIPSIRTWREAIFAGWFGPIGVGAIFLSLLGKKTITKLLGDHVDLTHPLAVVQPYLYPTVAFLTLASIVVHGITIPIIYLGQKVRTRSRSITVTSAINNVVTRLPMWSPTSNSTNIDNTNNTSTILEDDTSEPVELKPGEHVANVRVSNDEDGGLPVVTLSAEFTEDLVERTQRRSEDSQRSHRFEVIVPQPQDSNESFKQHGLRQR